MIVATVAAGTVAVTGCYVAGRRSAGSSNLAQEKCCMEEIHGSTGLGFATCRFDGARRKRRLYLSVMGDMLIFREPSGELAELLPLREMQVSSNSNTIDIEAGSHKISLQLDESRHDEEDFLRELEAAKNFLNTTADRMARVREALKGGNTKMNEGEHTFFCINEERLSKKARDYLAKNSFVVERLSESFNAMLRDMPPFPHTFLADSLLSKTKVPFLHARSATPLVVNTAETPKAIKMDEAESDGEREDGQMRRNSLEKWDRMDWSISSLPSSLAPNTMQPAGDRPINATVEMVLNDTQDQKITEINRKMADINVRLSKAVDIEKENARLKDIEKENARLKHALKALESLLPEETRKSQVPSGPQTPQRDLRQNDPEVDSPKMAFLRLVMNSPTWRKQSPSKRSPSRSRDLSSPSRNAESPSTYRSFNNGWNAVA